MIFLDPVDAVWRCTVNNVKLRDQRGRKDTENIVWLMVCGATAPRLELCTLHCLFCVSVMYVLVHIHVEVRGQHQMSSFTLLSQSLSLNLEPSGHWAPRTYWSPPPIWVCRHRLPCLALCVGFMCGLYVWVSEFRSSCFCGKHVISWAISLALDTW